jgi:hypothetical protein
MEETINIALQKVDGEYKQSLEQNQKMYKEIFTNEIIQQLVNAIIDIIIKCKLVKISNNEYTFDVSDVYELHVSNINRLYTILNHCNLNDLKPLLLKDINKIKGIEIYDIDITRIFKPRNNSVYPILCHCFWSISIYSSTKRVSLHGKIRKEGFLKMLSPHYNI